MQEVSVQRTLRAYTKANDFVKLGSCGQKGHLSSLSPFMSSSIDTAVDEEATAKEVHDLLARVSLPAELVRIYRIINRPDCEYVFGRWVLLSLKQVVEQAAIRIEHGQKRLVDFALKYEGMGHCTLCSYDPKSGKVYYHEDGGSCGQERDVNFEKGNRHVPTETELMPVEEWFEAVKNEME